MSTVRRVVSGLLGVAAAFTANSAGAQGNLDAGKSPAQIFSTTCSACHRSPRELKRSSESFLRSHYTTGREEAAAMAGYLGTVGSDPNVGQAKRAPTPGAPDNQKSSRREPPPAPATPDAQSSRRTSAPGEPKAGETKAQGRNAASSKRGRTEPETRPPAPAAEPPPPPTPVLETFEE